MHVPARRSLRVVRKSTLILIQSLIMDETKILTGVADASTAASEAAPLQVSAEEPQCGQPEAGADVSAVEAEPQQPVLAEPETPEEQPEAAEEQLETAEEQPEAAAEQPEFSSKEEVLARLKDIVYNKEHVERQELEKLKMLYYRFRGAETLAAREAFIAQGGEAEQFVPAPDPLEEEFKAQYSLIKELRNQAAQQIEAEKQQNLQRKQTIIERLKELAASPDTADKGYDEVKKLQAEWKEIKLVPAENATELWKNYQLYVEQFYDQLRLNHEMRAYDFKKNLELKTKLCEAAEKLADVEDVISAFHQLQKLHQEFRETGPVAKDLREDIWKRFKEASTLVNKRHQEHFESLKAREEENLQKKTELASRQRPSTSTPILPTMRGSRPPRKSSPSRPSGRPSALRPARSTTKSLNASVQPATASSKPRRPSLSPTARSLPPTSPPRMSL